VSPRKYSVPTEKKPPTLLSIPEPQFEDFGEMIDEGQAEQGGVDSRVLSAYIDQQLTKKLDGF